MLPDGRLQIIELPLQLHLIDVVRTDGRSERHSVVSGLILKKGDIIRVRTGSGGGYGNPAERAREAVIDDVKSGYVSAEVAEKIYGVKV